MKRRLTVSLLLIMALIISLLAFTGCNDNKNDNGNTVSGGEKQVPVYQGMSITNANPTTLSITAPSYGAESGFGASENEDETLGGENGTYGGDISDRNETVDEENPFPENGADENIEEEIKSSLTVIGASETIYYAEPNQNIYINIHIDNPDSFEIMSFTLNGKKYSTYMFEEGSDMETIILKYNVGAVSGIIEYTIDAIKYIDGTEIKDVLIDGNKTVMAGVKTQNQLALNLTGVDIDTNALSFNAVIKDNDNLIAFSKGVLKAVVYDGFEIVAEKDLAVGANSVSFEGLKTNTLYQYAVVGYYDDLSGDGYKMNILYKDAFYTDSVVLFDKISIGKESISFEYIWHENHTGKSISALKLYSGDRLVQTPKSDATSISNLLSDTKYKLVAEYANGENTEIIFVEFTTLTKVIPTLNVTNTAKTKDSLGFEVSVSDTDSVGSISKIEVVHGNKATTLSNETEQTLTNLLSNNEYTLRVTYTYDLNDGTGSKTIVKELSAKTDAKATPEISVINPTKTQTSVGFEISETDTDSVGAVTKIELVHANGTVSATSLEQRSFTNLLSNNSYTVKVTYTYNLNDGAGDKIMTKNIVVNTLAKSTPAITITSTAKTQDSLGFEVSVSDTDSVGSISKIEVVHGNKATTLSNETEQTLTNLLSNNEYTLRVTYTYNLNDGAGTQTLIKELSAKTDAKATPEISVINPTKTQTSVGFEISETDNDSVGAVTKIELVHANGTVSATSLAQRSFTNLLSNNSYTVKVTYVYDLNDGEGEHTITRELNVTTDAKAIPEISVINPTKTQTSVGFEISETDTDSVGEVTKIELVHANGTVNATSLEQRSFANLLSNNAYTVKVTYVYDLNDGEGEHTVTRELNVTTDAKTAPAFTVKSADISTDSITAEYDITDGDNILSSYKVELYKQNTLVKENTSKKIEFAGLSYYTDYTVRITYKYNLNDGVGVQTVTRDYAFKTLPFIDVIECDIANTSAVSEGETIFMSVKLNNPLNMSIKSVVINGETYNVTGASTKNKIFVEIVYNGQFAGGDTYLKIDKLNATLDGAEFTVEPKSELSDNVFINGKLEVVKIEIVNEDFEPVDWAFPSDKLYLLITLNNPTGYTVDKITQESWYVSDPINRYKRYRPTVTASVIRIDDNHWYYEISDTEKGQNFLSLTSLDYSNEYISKTITCSEIKAQYYRVESDDPKYISTPADLKNMNGRYYYVLKNDIDLSGIEWIGEGFNGVLEGNGYSIKNMSFVGTVTNKDAYLGLFRCGEGVIQNLHIKEATIIAEITSNDSNAYSVFCGGLVARGYYLNIHNCSVDEYSIFTVNNKTGGNYTYAGGLIGYVNHEAVTITNSTNSGAISASGGSFTYAGGLIGESSETIITNSTNSGAISADSYAGGLIGYVYYDSTITITNSTNSGAISSDYCAGGLIGYVDSSSTITITNSYSLTSGNGSKNGTPCTVEQLNSKAFYTEVLGWSEDVWDFSELDIENGKYPKLK